MKQTKQWIGWLTALCLTLLVLVSAGCGGSGGSSVTPVAPAALTGVTATAGDTQVSLNWTLASDATSYNVYYATTAGVTTSSVTKVTGLTGPASVTGLANGTAYHFVVTAVSANGESAVSNEVTATPVPPAPVKPSSIVVSGGDSSATIQWGAVTGADSYNVYYATAAGVTTTNSTKLTGVTSGSTITPLSNGTTYYFVVSAVNLGGESPLSSEKSAKPAAALQAPGNPANVVVTAGTGQATVTWAAVGVATSYNIYYLQSSASSVLGADVVAGGTKITNVTSPQVVTGLTSGSRYYFVVTAVNAGGESGPQPNGKAANIL